MSIRRVYLHFEAALVDAIDDKLGNPVRFLLHEMRQRYHLRRGLGDLANKVSRDVIIATLAATFLFVAGAWYFSGPEQAPGLLYYIVHDLRGYWRTFLNTLGL